MLIRKAVVVSCALLALVTACSGSSTTPKVPLITPTTRARVIQPPRTTTTVVDRPTTTPGTTAPESALALLILDQAPPGYVLQADSAADTGPTDFDKAAREDVSPNARSALLLTGFVAGYQRQWTSLDDNGDAVNQDFLFLYEFESAEGAANYARHWQSTLVGTNQGAKLHSFVPPLVPGAIGLRVEDKVLGSTSVVIFTKGQYAVQVLVSGGGSAQSGPGTLAIQQYARLP